MGKCFTEMVTEYTTVNTTETNIIHTAHLFPLLDQQLIALLKSLSAAEWNQRTIAKLWTVKDIAAHLLDTNLRTLSLARDQHTLSPETDINNYNDLVTYLNQLNADWVKAAKRISPQLIIDLLEYSGNQCSAYWQQLDLYADAVFSVAWAGEQQSKNWFHIAREYTEKFIHQQQIRDAVNKQGIVTKELFYPFIQTFMQALPYTYRNVEAPEGTVVKVTISTDIGGSWFIVKTTNNWEFTTKTNDSIAAHISIDPQTAWKLFSKGLSASQARPLVVIEGDEALGAIALTMISVMA
ncbi:MAG: maleylpyruvate isomerase N-terminal domain-containing protein [Chitinophagaceae bacterium]|jgi:hypothetical protein|nr:maleylpyruvate isomerase N-terminal domain-containing protein [Chitinophagaceae bacterium]